MTDLVWSGSSGPVEYDDGRVGDPNLAIYGVWGNWQPN
jgi:hypothetical protein